MSTLPSAYRQIIDPLIDVARAILERGERVVPVAFVGNLTAGETYQVMMSAASDQAKGYSAELVRHLASIHQADFVFVIMDAWGLPRDKVRIDMVALSLETRHGVWRAQMPVQPKGASNRKRAFSLPEFQLFTETKGRFVDLLPVKDGEERAPGGLR